MDSLTSDYKNHRQPCILQINKRDCGKIFLLLPHVHIHMKGYDFFENNCTRRTFGGIHCARDSGQYEKGKGKQGTFKGLIYLSCVLFLAARCINRKIIRINQIGNLYKLIFFGQLTND